MSRRELLEEEIDKLQKQIDKMPEDSPFEDVDPLRKRLDDLSFELDNLYDDEEIELPD